MKRLSMRIGATVLVVLTVVMLAEALVLGYVLSTNISEVRERLARQGAALVTLIAESGIEPPRVAAGLASRLAAYPNLSIGMYDDAGRLVASGGTRERLQDTLSVALRNEAIANAGDIVLLRPIAMGSPTDLIAAVDGPGMRFIALHEASPEAAFPAARMSLLVTAGVVTLVFALAVTALLVSRVRAAIKHVQGTVQAMKAGNLAVRLAEPGDDELGALARDFNAMARRLAEHIGRLEGEDERRRALFAAFTHEVNTPLSAVLGYLESLDMLEVDAEPATRRRFVKVAYEQARQLESLADDLATLSQLGYDGLRLNLDAVDLSEVATTTAEGLRLEAAARGGKIVVESDALIAEGDHGRMAQVLRSVIVNALQHAGSEPKVTVSVVADGEMVGFDVADDGPGVPMEVVARLGSPLLRSERAGDAASNGRGLGLAIAHGIVAAHHGLLTITSPPGKGTVVEIRVPRFRGSDGPDGQDPDDSGGHVPSEQ